MRRTILAVILLLASHGAARADEGGSTLVVPIADVSGASSEALLARLGEVLVSSLEGSGFEAKAAQVGMGDILGMAGCTLEDRRCLRRLPAALEVEVVVLGWVESSSGGALDLVLYRVRRDSVRQSRHRLEGDDDEARADALAVALGLKEEKTERGSDEDETAGPRAESEDEGAKGPAEEASSAVEESEPVPPPAPERPPADDPKGAETAPQPLETSPEGAGFSLGRARGYAWAIAGAGAAVALGSLVPYLLAEDKQDEINAFNPRTEGDFRALEDLEGDARARYRLGHAMLIGGAALTATGAALIFYQAAQDEPSERPTLTLSPAPRGGSGFVLTLFGTR